MSSAPVIGRDLKSPRQTGSRRRTGWYTDGALRLTRKRLAAACIGLLVGAGFLAGSSALASQAVPEAGNWEGVGPHNLPLSFSLSRRGGRLVATSVVVGAPLTCPPNERDAEAVPLARVAYSGPDGGSSEAGDSATLSGVVPGRHQHALLPGQFSSSTSGTFALQVNSTVGCGWPSQTLTWQVHRVRRSRVGDALWSARLHGRGITSGHVEVGVAGNGRVVRSFRATYDCRSSSSSGKGGFDVSPAYEFVRPGGRFFSPLHGNALRGRRTLWSGRFTRARGLVGILSIYDTCTRRIVLLRFRR